MALIPDWFEDNFWDVEQLFVDVFKKVFPEIDPDNIGVWTPDDWLEETDPGPLLQFIRLPGGHVDYDMNYDECLIQAVAVTPSRSDSNAIISVICACLLPMQGFKLRMDDGGTVQIHGATEVEGPQMLTDEQMIDMRVVPATFRVRVGLKSRARYLAELSAL